MNLPEQEQQSSAMETAENKPVKATPETSKRTNKNGDRRGKFAFAAPLGTLVSVLAVVGVISLIFGGVSLVQKATDTTQLKDELYYYLEPVLYYQPEPFDNIAETEQDVFLSAAAGRLTSAEQIRMLVENDEDCHYAVDEQGRVAISVDDITASYRALFGPDAPLTHRSLDEAGLVYSQADACYYVPFEALAASYVPFIQSVHRSFGSYVVRVGYVASGDIRMDAHGNQLEPTEEDATLFQTFTLTKTADSYYISACRNQ